MTETYVSNCLSCSYLSKADFPLPDFLGLFVLLLFLVCFGVTFDPRLCYFCYRKALDKALTQLRFASRHVSSKPCAIETMELYRCLVPKNTICKRNMNLYWRSMHFIDVPLRNAWFSEMRLQKMNALLKVQT